MSQGDAATSAHAAPPTTPPPPGVVGGKGGSSLALVWGVGIGLAVGVLILVVVVALQRASDETSRGVGGRVTGPSGPQGSSGSGVLGDAPVPGIGNEVYIGGGLARVAVPEGWALVTRVNRTDDPGGYAEGAVVTRIDSGATIAVYLMEERSDPGEAAQLVSNAALVWTSTGREVAFGAVKPIAPFGAVAGGAALDYGYTRQSPMEGEVVAAILKDGTPLLVFVDTPRGTLESGRAEWQPLRDAILRGFGA